MKKQVLISGASIAGLSAAYWMNETGYEVRIIETPG
jgi:2-polyprenyl-6-methoxyphenol hydroxylase-like FAD-dependent oxidoreductase